MAQLQISGIIDRFLNPPDWYWPQIDIQVDWPENCPPGILRMIAVGTDPDVCCGMMSRMYPDLFSEDQMDVLRKKYKNDYMLQRHAKWLVDLKQAIDDLTTGNL
jgi:hypothetical protein